MFKKLSGMASQSVNGCTAKSLTEKALNASEAAKTKAADVKEAAKIASSEMGGRLWDDMPGSSNMPFLEQLSRGTESAKRSMQESMESALTSDDQRVDQLLDAAIASGMVGRDSAVPAVRRAAESLARKQLEDAVESGNPQKIKGALVVARRLDATELIEFQRASEKYRELNKLPEGWNVARMLLERRKPGKLIAFQELENKELVSIFQELFDSTHRKVYTRDRKSDSVPSRLEVVSVAEVQNDQLWVDYITRRERIRSDLQVLHDTEPRAFRQCKTVDTLATNLPGPDLAADLNEVMLFHGTNPIAMESIATGAFKVNLAGSNTGTLYGRGIYLGDNCTKGDEYAPPDENGLRTILICRVVLGRVYYTDVVTPDPRQCEDRCLVGTYHSVLGDRRKCRGTFREFVLFDDAQAYPNFVVKYRRQDCPSCQVHDFIFMAVSLGLPS